MRSRHGSRGTPTEAEPPSGQDRWTQIVARLTENPDAFSWPERRDLARAAGELFVCPDGLETAAALAELLAVDAKWEVRQAVAELLPQMPDDLFARLAARLSEDPNSFVARATQRALDRRRRGVREAARKRRGAEQVQADYQLMERLHGRQAAERARRIGERLYEVMVGATVHDLRGVITPLKSGATALLAHLQRGRLDRRLLREGLGRINERVGFMERLLADMRAYAQAVPMERPRIRLAQVVSDAQAMALENLIADGQDVHVVEWSLSVPEDISLEIARHQIVVALANVLKNAVESLADGHGALRPGHVRIRAETTEDEVRITVADNGTGLAPEDLCEISEFIPGRTSKKNRGTGFGLPIARRNIAAHGGSISLDSEENQGTTVTIVLPLEAPVEERE